MIKEDLLNYYIAIYRCPEHSDIEKLCSPKYEICLIIPRKYVVSLRQVINAFYHYIDTIHIKKWIRNKNLRYAAFLLRESQISNIVDKLEENDAKLLIIISREPPKLGLEEAEIPKKTGDDMLSETAIFRLTIEKERK